MKSNLFVTAIAGAILYGCSSLKITHTWESPTARQKEYSKIMVLALIKDKDRSLGEKMENHLVGDLTDLGYNAVSSLKENGLKSFEGMREEEVVTKLQNSGADALITIVLLDKEKERRYVPASVMYSPYNYYHRRFWGYYSTMNSRIYEPGYYAEQTNYFWESNLYDLESKELLYSVQTKSFDPGSAGSMGHAYGKLIVKDMLQHSLFIAKK
jgi:hypothetical protein